MEWYQNVIVIGILLVIAFAIMKSNKKDLKLELNKLVELLGGKENILDTEVEMSRFKVTLRDVTKANKEGILKLGAKGVVEIDDQLKIVLVIVIYKASSPYSIISNFSSSYSGYFIFILLIELLIKFFFIFTYHNKSIPLLSF